MCKDITKVHNKIWENIMNTMGCGKPLHHNVCREGHLCVACKKCRDCAKASGCNEHAQGIRVFAHASEGELEAFALLATTHSQDFCERQMLRYLDTIAKHYVFRDKDTNVCTYVNC